MSSALLHYGEATNVRVHSYLLIYKKMYTKENRSSWLEIHVYIYIYAERIALVSQ